MQREREGEEDGTIVLIAVECSARRAESRTDHVMVHVPKRPKVMHAGACHDVMLELDFIFSATLFPWFSSS